MPWPPVRSPHVPKRRSGGSVRHGLTIGIGWWIDGSGTGMGRLGGLCVRVGRGGPGSECASPRSRPPFAHDGATTGHPRGREDRVSNNRTRVVQVLSASLEQTTGDAHAKANSSGRGSSHRAGTGGCDPDDVARGGCQRGFHGQGRVRLGQSTDLVVVHPLGCVCVRQRWGHDHGHSE